MSTITLFTPFSPMLGRVGDVWRNAVFFCPQITHAVLCNNSGKSLLRQESFLAELCIPCRSFAFDFRFDTLPGRARAACMAEMWNRFLKEWDGSTDFVLSLEEDILPPTGTLQMLLDDITSPDAWAAGPLVRSRHTLHYMTYVLQSVDPWKRADPPFGPVMRDRSYDVQSLSTSMLLIRKEALEGFSFTGNPNADGTGGNGHEWSLMKHILLHNKRIICNGIPLVRHYQSKQEFVV